MTVPRPALDAESVESNEVRRERLGMRSAELQQQWHGWGSPVGLGFGLLALGGLLLLVAVASSVFASIGD